MTKIKNTKKGMAKKTLSMSLVVAMLATSNVPVWAAEFSDGTDATAVTSEAEAFSADETDVPAVEDTESDDIAVASVAGITGLTFLSTTVKKSELNGVTAFINSTVQATLSDAPTDLTSGNCTGVKLIWSVGEVSAETIIWKNIKTVAIPETVIAAAATPGTEITVQAKFIEGNYSGVTVQGNLKETPAETEKIKVTGNSIEDYKQSTELTFTESTAVVGTALTLNTFSVYDNAQVAYTWYADGEKIENVSGTSYTPTADMIGKTITVQAAITHSDFPGETATVKMTSGIKVDDNNSSTELTKTSHSGYDIDWDMDGSADKTWPEYTYTGDEFRPSIKKITRNGKEFNSSDYQLSWKNNKNAETGAVKPELIVTFTSDAIAKDNTLPKRLSIKFTIKQADFTKATVTASKTPSYAADADEVAAVRNAGLTVKLGDKTLTEYDAKLNPDGKYEIDNSTDLTKVGTKTGKIVIKPRDTSNYAGTVTLTTDVNRKDINELYIAPIADVTFDGTEKEPSLTVKYNKDGSAIVATGNYEVTYSNNILSGQATAHVKGINNYTGTRDITFNIKTADNSLETALKNLIINAGTNVDYTGSDIDYVKSAYVDATGTLYAINRDFTVEYQTQHKNAGNCRVKVSGAGVYAGQSFIVDFTILPKSMTGFTQNTSAAFGKEITVEDLTYDPETISYKPEVTITYNGTTLQKDVDYEVEYGAVDLKNKKVPVTIKGKGNFIGTPLAQITGKIVAKDIKKVTFSEIAQQKYTGSAITAGNDTFTIKAKDGNTDLKEGTDFHVVKYNNNVKSGVATITIAGLGNYQGETTLTFLIVDREYTASIVRVDSDGTGSTLLPSKTYTRSAANSTVDGIKGITLGKGTEFKVVDNSTGKDIPVTNYKVTYENNTAAGTATIKVEGIDGNKISAINTFEIKPAVLPTVNFSDIATQIYTGSEIKPNVKITAADSTDSAYKLVEGTDYEVSYEKNTDVGTAKVVVTGKGNYAGLNADKTVNHKDTVFSIIRASISRSEIALNDVAYAGGIEVTPALKIVNPVSGKELVKGTDYTITLKDGVNVGVATVTIKLTDNAKKNYDLVKGAETATFHITKKSLADCDVTVKKEKDGTLTTTVMNGIVKETAEKFETKDNGNGTATVSVVDGGKNYTGTATVTVADESKVGKTEISSVKVVGNKATVILSGDAEGASGYDYVISTDKDCTTSKDYDAISKNQVKTSTAFKYVQKGTYYAYCHAWTRDKNGKKVFGDWSEGYEFKVKATTPAAPVITEAKVKGSTITVTYNKVSNVAGYDVVLGTSSKNDNGELRPYRYGDHKILNINKNTVTVQFKNVPKKNWVVGMRSFTKDPDTNKKVFSRWSNLMPAKVK